MTSKNTIPHRSVEFPENTLFLQLIRVSFGMEVVVMVTYVPDAFLIDCNLFDLLVPRTRALCDHSLDLCHQPTTGDLCHQPMAGASTYAAIQTGASTYATTQTGDQRHPYTCTTSKSPNTDISPSLVTDISLSLAYSLVTDISPWL